MHNMAALKVTEPAMLDISITEAKSRLAELVQQAERGQAVRITRRGRAVAVLVSVAEHTRLTTDRVGVLAYSQAWRSQTAAAGLKLSNEEDWDGLRDQSERSAPDLA